MPITIKKDFAIIAKLNDEVRSTFKGGKIVYSQKVKDLPAADRIKLFGLIQSFSHFTQDNDPCREHDFGRITFDDRDYLFMINYYDQNGQGRSTNPADPEVTKRELTILRSDEEFCYLDTFVLHP